MGDNRCHLEGNGQLQLYSYHLDESADVTYKTSGSYNQEGLERIHHILRSPDGFEHPIDIKVIEIIDDIQDHFRAKTVEIISGYRSPAYNKHLQEEGRHVARESLHLLGEAIDFHLDEVTEEAIRHYALTLGCGGVGFYPGHDFIHVDVGPRRGWESPETKRMLVGIDNNPSLNRLETDRNDYFRNNSMTLTLLNNTPSPVRPEVCGELERFDRGRWLSVGMVHLGLAQNIPAQERASTRIAVPPRECHQKKMPALPFGRYRIRLNVRSAEMKGDAILSNEFYFKKEWPINSSFQASD